MAMRVKSVAKRSSKYLEGPLYRRLFKDGSSAASVRRELDGFLKSRKRVFKWEVGVSIRKLRERKRFRPALKLSETMGRRGMNPTTSDHAIRLDLVAKAKGIAAAEEYFISLPDPAKNHLSYGALLNCYCKNLMTDKASALMEKMKELNFASTPMPYNSLMTLYSKTNHPERIPAIIQEMKAYDVMPDCFTYNIWMRGLAAMGDISGVERVVEEMKRDGRVTADWTTYSNLASIYVGSGMFQKAEASLKELEKRNGDRSLEAYQFLLTLYGRIGNLTELHRIWRSLKLARSNKMANISYLNMIQALAKLKDLPGAESCYKEWESRCVNYDIRLANALISAYCKEDMLEKAEALKKHAKGRGGRLNSKTWEIFMDYYMRKGEMKSALRCIDRGIKKGISHARVWVPPAEAVREMMGYFERNKNVLGAEKFIELVRRVDKELGAEVFESLVRTYAAAGKKSPGMRRRLKMEGVVASEATEKLLQQVATE